MTPPVKFMATGTIPGTIPTTTTIPSLSSSNSNKSTLINDIDFNDVQNAKIIEESLKLVENNTKIPSKSSNIPVNPINIPSSSMQNIPPPPPPPPVMQNIPPSVMQPIQNIQQLQHEQQQKMMAEEQQRQLDQQRSLSNGSSIEQFLPTLKYNLKYPAFLFKQVNLKKFIILVVISIIFQLPAVRNVMMENSAKITTNVFIPCIILGLLNSAIYFTLDQIVE